MRILRLLNASSSFFLKVEMKPTPAFYTYLLIIYSLLFVAPAVKAQTFKFNQDQSIPLIYQNDTLVNAWAGGLNASQYSTIHLNNDETEDLIVFDRTTNTLRTFLATSFKNTLRYVYVPQYESEFPPALESWILLADYNRDGNKDIFTHTTLGVKVYKNTSNENGLSWQLIANPLETQGFSGLINLLIAVSDIPAITDLDNDGDLDILTFDGIGDMIEFHQNQSIEKYNHADALEFKKVNTCWGKFRQGVSCEEYIFGEDCGTVIGRIHNPLRVQHTGSSLLITDLDGDGDKDLLNGHVGCQAMVKLTNNGNTQQAIFNEIDADFPASEPINFPVFPAAFFEDLDFDGKKDLIVSPNVTTNEGNFINFRESNWLYKNTGSNDSPVFAFNQTDFLQSTMLDVGENAFPALADYDGDGDTDLFIGTRGNYNMGNGRFYATIHLYENIGTPEKASFEIITEDYLNLSSLQLTFLKPSFTDVNNDRVPDLVFANTYNNGRNTDLKYILNAAPQNSAFQFSLNNIQTLPLTFDANDTPLLYDLDGDNILDALVGKFYGNIEYYLNTGTNTNPVYNLRNEFLGGLPVDPFDRNVSLTMADLDFDGKADLISGDRNGKIKVYADVLNQLAQSLNPDTSIIWNPIANNYIAAKLDGFIFPAAADLNNDKLPELLVGTQAGGIIMLKNTSEAGNPDPEPTESGLLGPNPVDTYLYLNLLFDSEVNVYSVLGQSLIDKRKIMANQKTPLDFRNFPAGIYLIKISSPEVSTVKKIVVRH
ncbi:T9SS type A sorting domain-containing protein [Rhodocytophaga rosea]|uniref:T9SS type A sorting domain-containing protein n=1 Tax=Rhodocytophaga rosea TaxID=2704465 RepID=A0A6C0GF79_9BACT|nr:FG-GAP-like repeat-containing protein [Rhodocytophaga rosea]QHT66320.1 T9SS type A sorting domain-containing protein [Rhodocytophaga rosea]